MAEKQTDTASAETLRDEIRKLQEDIAAIAKTVREIGAEEGEKAYGRVRASAERAKSEVEQTASTVGRQIEERPLTAVFTAFLLGAILGALISRR
ncbi:MAG: YqjD family protein [Rhodospirillales bacterium]